MQVNRFQISMIVGWPVANYWNKRAPSGPSPNQLNTEGCLHGQSGRMHPDFRRAENLNTSELRLPRCSLVDDSIS